jgi:hypothetical protein
LELSQSLALGVAGDDEEGEELFERPPTAPLVAECLFGGATRQAVGAKMRGAIHSEPHL